MKRLREVGNGWLGNILTITALVLLLLVILAPTIVLAQRWRWCFWYNNQNQCERNGCYWWNNSCHTYPPSCSQPDNQDDCERYGCYWWSGSCHDEPLKCENYTTQTACEANPCYWYNDACHSDAASCEELINEGSCNSFGCYWWNGACHSEAPSCEAINNESDCIAYGCSWYNSACHSEEPPGPGADVEMPCAVPPFLSETVPPNVLIIMDNSGSMNYPAYIDQNSSNPTQYDYGSYIPDMRYYGYADPDSHYYLGENRFEVTTTWNGTADPANQRFSGNFLNWMMSRRIDIARQVLVGGKCASRQFSGRKTLIWEDPAQDRNYYKYYWCDDGCRWRFVNHYDQYLYAYKRSGCNTGSSYNYQWKAPKKIVGPEEPHGFVQEIYDRVRFGVMHFNSSEGGYVSHWIGGPMSSLVTDIE
ncbi:hypothetical protein DRQ33_02000, partial [bacterium]